MESAFRKFLPPPPPGALPRSYRDAAGSLDALPPPVRELVEMWRQLRDQEMRGICADGSIQQGLFSLATCGAPTHPAAAAARRWLGMLSAEQRAAVTRPVDAHEWHNWDNTPMVLRAGLVELYDLGEAQKRAALDVLRASLSPEGYELARNLMRLNAFLGDIVGQPNIMREWDYALTIFGEPSESEPWGWQFFGHHLALNCLFVGGQMTLTPTFMGAEPNIIDEGEFAGTRFFEKQESGALALMRSLPVPMQAQATIFASMRTADQIPCRFHQFDGRMRGGAYQDNRVVPYEGAFVSEFTQLQRRDLLDVVEAYLLPLPNAPRQARIEEIQRHIDTTRFAWIGETGDESPFYYRIHSPVVLIEFDHHQGVFLNNEEPAKFHIHSVIRTPNGNDYGRDILRQHQEHAHHGGK